MPVASFLSVVLPFLPLLLLIAGIDDDKRNRTFATERERRKNPKKEKRARMLANTLLRHRSVDHGMSLLVTATFLPCSRSFGIIMLRTEKKKKNARH